jgi:hypothetical protein
VSSESKEQRAKSREQRVWSKEERAKFKGDIIGLSQQKQEKPKRQGSYEVLSNVLRAKIGCCKYALRLTFGASFQEEKREVSGS